MTEIVTKSIKTGFMSLTCGIPIGLLASYFLTRREGINFYISVPFLIVFVIAYIACIIFFSFIPARYASKIKPVEALREE